MSKDRPKIPDKKSFLLYCDQAELIRKLSDEQAGNLIKQIFSYCGNGRTRPEIPDPLTDIVFTALQTSLDRDHLKYLKIVERNRNNGQLGGRPKNNPLGSLGTQKTQANPENPSEPDSDSDSDSDNGNEKHPPLSPKGKPKISFKTYLQEKIIENNFIESKDKIFEFYEYRMGLPKAKQYQSEKGINGLFRDLNGCRDAGLIVSECLEIAMEKPWLTPDPTYFKTNKVNGVDPSTAERAADKAYALKHGYEWRD